MVQLRVGWHEPESIGMGRPLRVERQRMVVLEWASPAQTVVAEALHGLAQKVASNNATAFLLQTADKTREKEQKIP